MRTPARGCLTRRERRSSIERMARAARGGRCDLSTTKKSSGHRRAAFLSSIAHGSSCSWMCLRIPCGQMRNGRLARLSSPSARRRRRACSQDIGPLVRDGRSTSAPQAPSRSRRRSLTRLLRCFEVEARWEEQMGTTRDAFVSRFAACSTTPSTQPRSSAS
jgi:hypothetical protein